MSSLPPRSFDAEYSDAYQRIPGLKNHLGRIQNARVLVAGVGALGNELLKNLALYNVGYLFICDLDVVEWANLSHSVLFRKEDNEQPKVVAAARSIARLNPQITTRPFFGSISDIGLGVWREMDLVVAGLDNRGARLLIDRACARAGKDWVDGGLGSLVPSAAETSAAGIFQGVVQGFSPGRGYAYEHYLQTDSVRQAAEQEARVSRRAHRNWLGCTDVRSALEKQDRVPTTPTMASLVGAIQAQEAIRMLCPTAWDSPGIGFRRLSVDAFGFNFSWMEHPRGAEQPPLGPVLSDRTLSARMTTVAEMTARAREDLGPAAVVELGFRYCSGLKCAVCGEVDARPFKLGSRSAACPRCSTQDLVVERAPLPGQPMLGFLRGNEDFPNLTLHELGVPLFDVLTASVYESAGVGRRRVLREQIHYELAGDAEEALGCQPRAMS